ncbi:hypothetical protein AAF712_002798 [Marasmius tenuissimus]|uniref:Uncharacterized protein n=1 Tax=Marasmius tenuissimus TaxID=585030 RepID=A0ABR3AAB0_9AGAR
MPTLSNASEVVLVTGANGFIATWTIGNLLKRGYTVRAAVRDESRGKHLLQTYQSYGDKLYLFAVGDMQKLKRVVFTSTCLTIHDFSMDDVTVSEADWNEKAVRECEEKGSEAHPLSMYSASKTLAEKGEHQLLVLVLVFLMLIYNKNPAAWALYEENKNKISWDFTVVNLPWVVGVR